MVKILFPPPLTLSGDLKKTTAQQKAHALMGLTYPANFTQQAEAAVETHI